MASVGAKFTLAQLLASGVKARPTQNPVKRVEIHDYYPNVRSKTLLVKGQAQGIAESRLYPVSIQFTGCEFSDKSKPGHIQHSDEHGNNVWLKKLNINQFVQVRCQCVTGDTLVPLADGYSIPISDLVGKPEFYVYSYDLKINRRVIGRGHSARLTGKKVPIVKVTLDNGTAIRCTPDHLFLTKDSGYKQAKDLQVDEFLQTLHRDSYVEPNNIRLVGYEILSSSNNSYKVISIEEDGYDDVYDVSVDDYDNFAVDVDNGKDCSSGIFIHNCKDFYFMWQFWDKGVGALFGPPFPKYVRKTTTYPEKNPGRHPGLCKHLLVLVERLKARGLLE